MTGETSCLDSPTGHRGHQFGCSSDFLAWLASSLAGFSLAWRDAEVSMISFD